MFMSQVWSQLTNSAGSERTYSALQSLSTYPVFSSPGSLWHGGQIDRSDATFCKQERCQTKMSKCLSASHISELPKEGKRMGWKKHRQKKPNADTHQRLV